MYAKLLILSDQPMKLIVLAEPAGEDQVDGGLEVPAHDGQGFPGEWLVLNPHLSHSEI